MRRIRGPPGRRATRRSLVTLCHQAGACGHRAGAGAPSALGVTMSVHRRGDLVAVRTRHSNPGGQRSPTPLAARRGHTVARRARPLRRLRLARCVRVRRCERLPASELRARAPTGPSGTRAARPSLERRPAGRWLAARALTAERRRRSVATLTRAQGRASPRRRRALVEADGRREAPLVTQCHEPFSSARRLPGDLCRRGASAAGTTGLPECGAQVRALPRCTCDVEPGSRHGSVARAHRVSDGSRTPELALRRRA